MNFEEQFPVERMCDANSLKKIFQEFDSDNSGQIDIKELKGMVRVYFETLKVEADDAMVKDVVYVSKIVSTVVY